MVETNLTKNQILSELSKSPHGKLAEYVPVGKQAATREAEFFAHLIAWDRTHGQIRDAKIALPVISLMVPFPEDLVENSYAHIGMLSPRELVKAFYFAKEQKLLKGRMNPLQKLVLFYLRELESKQPVWERAAIQHRNSLKTLYAVGHFKPCSYADSILFKMEYPRGSIFESIAQLASMSPAEAAGTIMQRRIPFLVAMASLGDKAKNPDLVLALIKQMSPTELVTNAKSLEKLGVKTNPVLRGAFDEALAKVAVSKKNVLKTTRAIENMADGEVKEKLRGAQDKQLKNMAVDGNWLVLADRSGSMSQAIEVGRHVAAVLAKMVKGKVYLVFFNVGPQGIDVTGKTLDEIKTLTRNIMASGGTSIGCGLEWAMAYRHEIDGIAIVSDGGDNTVPFFHTAYQKYSQFAGKEVPVYLYHLDGEYNALADYCKSSQIDLQTFELVQRGFVAAVDYYSIPNLVQTMRTNKFSLVDEIMTTPLVGLHNVFKNLEKGETLLATQSV